MSALRTLGFWFLWLCLAITTVNMLWVASLFWVVGRVIGVIDERAPTWRETMKWVWDGGYLGGD